MIEQPEESHFLNQSTLSRERILSCSDGWETFGPFQVRLHLLNFLTIDESRECLAKYLTAPSAAHYDMEINLEYKLFKASGICGEYQCRKVNSAGRYLFNKNSILFKEGRIIDYIENSLKNRKHPIFFQDIGANGSLQIPFFFYLCIAMPSLGKIMGQFPITFSMIMNSEFPSF